MLHFRSTMLVRPIASVALEPPSGVALAHDDVRLQAPLRREALAAPGDGTRELLLGVVPVAEVRHEVVTSSELRVTHGALQEGEVMAVDSVHVGVEVGRKRLRTLAALQRRVLRMRSRHRRTFARTRSAGGRTTLRGLVTLAGGRPTSKSLSAGAGGRTALRGLVTFAGERPTPTSLSVVARGRTASRGLVAIVGGRSTPTSLSVVARGRTSSTNVSTITG